MAAAGGAITLSFSWAGSTCIDGGWQNGGRDIKCIEILDELVRYNATEFREKMVHVSLPENSSPQTHTELPFAVQVRTVLDTPGSGYTNTTEKTIQIAISTIRSLKPVVRSFVRGYTISDTKKQEPFGNLLKQPIQINVPKDLKPGSKYRLAVTSNNVSYTAELIEEGSATAAAAGTAVDKKNNSK